MAYVECGVTDFSTCSFQFYDLHLREVRTQTARDDGKEAVVFGGGYHYRENSLLTSSCRNRSIIWRYYDYTLEFVELSLDVNLANPALRVHIAEGCGPVVPRVSVVELASSVVIMFSTVTSVFRLVLPHPTAIAKDPSLVSAGKGLQPSIFTFVSEEMFTGCNRFLVTLGHPSPSVTSCASGLLEDSSSVFALASPNGSIYCVCLPPLGENDGRIPERFELKAQSVMRRLWSFLPVGGSGIDPQCPVSMEMHSFSGELIILTLCRDLTLKLWSFQQRDCLMEHNLTCYVTDLHSPGGQDQDKMGKLLLSKAHGGSDDLLKFAVCVDVPGVPQVLVFQLVQIGTQLVLDHLSSHNCSLGLSVVDLSVTDDKLWVVLADEEGMAVVKCFSHGKSDAEQNSDVVMLPPPATDVILTQHKDPREAYLDEIFHPGQFSMQSIKRALQLFGSVASTGTSFANLQEEVTITIEEEVKTVASSHELTHADYRELQLKCWSKFYTCCLQYEQLVMKPFGLSLDSDTATVSLIRQGTMSFIHSTSGSGMLSSLPLSMAMALTQSQECEDLPGAQDVAHLLQSIHWVSEQLNYDVLDSFLVELNYHSDSLAMAEEIAMALLTDENSGAMFTFRLQSILNEVLDLPAAINTILETLYPSLSPNEGGDRPERDILDEVHLATTGMFSSAVSFRLLGAAFRQICRRRLAFCRDFLLMVCILDQDSSDHCQVQELNLSDIAKNLSQLVHCYHSLYWLSTTPSLTVTTGTIEVNLNLCKLAALDISDGGAMISTRPDVAESRDCSLVELYLSTVGHERVLSELISTFPLCPHEEGRIYLSPTHHRMVDILLRHLWPLTSPSSLYEFLMANCQYSHVQALDAYLGGYIDGIEPFSRYFVMGQSYFGMGELEKAFQCFLAASGCLSNPDETELLLQKVAFLSGTELGGVSLGGYWVKVMRLFEKVLSAEWVVGVASVAVQGVPSNHPTAPLLWSNLFKYSLELNHYQTAYNAMMGNPDPDRRIDCLKRFVVVLADHGQLKQLCELAFTGMEEEVEQVMEQRARSMDVLGHKYYNLLYCYHTTRGNLQRAASFMYEQGLRLGLEAPGPASLQKQVNCYVAAITSLRLVKSKYAWIVRPADLDSQEMEVQVGTSNVQKQKKKKKASRRVKVVTLAGMEEEYQLVKTKLQLLHNDPFMATQLCNQYVSASDVQTLLLQAGLFDAALKLSRKCRLSLVPVFESLAGRCAHLTANLFSIKHGSADTTSWDWLGVNEASDTPQSREAGIIEQAWSMLQSYLEEHSGDEECELQGCVARKLLSMGANLPQWMIDRFKRTNPAKLLRLYLTFDLIEAATNLAMEHIDAVVGHGKEYFGLETALHATCPSVWLPYSALDQLVDVLSKVPPNSQLEELCRCFKVKLDKYLRQVDGVSERMRQEAIERLYMQHP